jgi:uncharacterized protein (DUF362 family)
VYERIDPKIPLKRNDETNQAAKTKEVQMWNKEYLRAPEKPFRAEPIAETFNPWEASTYKILDRPLLVPHKRSEVAITRAYTYANGMAEAAVEDAIELLGGMQRFCKTGDKVLIKPNAAAPMDKLVCLQESTHASILRPIVRLLKDCGAEVWIGESAAWEFNMEMTWQVMGYDKLAKEFGVKLCNWREEELINVKVPDPRYWDEMTMPKSILECDVFINVPKLKQNLVAGDRGLTVSLKNMIGCMLPLERRLPTHKTPIENAYACTEIWKIIGSDRMKLTVVDAIVGVEGPMHVGTRVNPGLVLASHDPVAVEAVCYYIAGYEFMDNPFVQIPMKAGLGTGDPREIRILGERLEDVRYKFRPVQQRYVQPYMNVHEYMGGGVCNICLMTAMIAPPRVEKDKLYAVVAGTRAGIPDNFAQYDEVWLVGTCACSPTHQLKGFMEKINKAKAVKKLNACGGNDALYPIGGFGGMYEPAWAPIGPDFCAVTGLPGSMNTNVLAEVEDRREGRETEFRHTEGLAFPHKKK